ncbi:ribonuclease [Candidatus Magnetobacterium bavaricum]|uniref:Ribonuclease Y n=1 Tax=Candidatus Magnetobacterium bavaricum TaxID=29290 RepID=A0A0F3GYS4_9BACT|nr:ribonuclease [Candidatus Magnetobacterium bavaricum]
MILCRKDGINRSYVDVNQLIGWVLGIMEIGTMPILAINVTAMSNILHRETKYKSKGYFFNLRTGGFSDMNVTDVIISILIGGAMSAFFALYFRQLYRKKEIELQGKQTETIREAEKEAEKIKKEALLEAKDTKYQVKAEAEKEIKEKRQEITHVEKRLRHKEELLDKKLDQFEKKDSEFSKREKEFGKKEQAQQDREKEYERLLQIETEKLEKISGITSEEAKSQLLKKVEDEVKLETGRLIKQIEQEAKEESEKRAKHIISLAIQRYSGEHVCDATVTAVTLPNEEMKGRIIGREGRNIRALEAATGVDFIVDDTPEAVTLSGFDPVRREIARISLERLISDGRIHPARIEEIVEKVRKEVNNAMREEGEKAVFDLGLTAVHPEFIKLLGRLKYRTSYGQNVLQHSKEVAYFAGMMAGELKADVKLAKRSGLLHDIGKALDHEIEGPHHEIGAAFAKKYGEDERVINAMLVHHGDGDPICVESALVTAADALSAARPGVRRESIENYIKRLQKLEEIAMSYTGVDKCYAIQAGREIRIIVKPEDTTDEMSYLISREIAKKIESEMTYPGQIKIMVIREARFVEYAR